MEISRNIFFSFAVILILPENSQLAVQETYQKPPKAVSDILNAPTAPLVIASPGGEYLLMGQREPYPPIAELAQPMLRLAGFRINPKTNGRHSPFLRFRTLELLRVADGKKQEIATGQVLGLPLWSADGKYLAFTNAYDTGIELLVLNAVKGEITRVPRNLHVNEAFARSLQWMSDNRTLVVLAVPSGRGKPPAEARAPRGPVIQQSSGKVAPVRTYQDLLRDEHDAEWFDYCATSQIVLHDVTTGKQRQVGKPGVIASVEPAPGGRLLLVTRHHRPYSYLHPAYDFPTEVEVWDLEGKVVHTLASLPLADQVPIEGVPTGPRHVHWRPTEPATLVWAEALDGGDPRKKAPHRDRVLMLKAPFTGEPAEICKTQHRCVPRNFRDDACLAWLEKDGLALVVDFERDLRRQRTFLVDVDHAGREPRLIWDLSIHDRYNAPGEPLMRLLPGGQHIIRQHDNSIFLVGPGASPKGDHPFLDRFDLRTLKSVRLFQSGDRGYETVLELRADDGSKFLTRYESPAEPPNYFVRSLADNSKTALTSFPDPTPHLRGITKQRVLYQRADGVPLSFTLYLPADYQKGRRLPAVLWAYPREFVDAGTAGQVAGSTQKFTTIDSISHLFFLTQGYAILDGASMPVIGDPKTVNNTYIDQIVSSAKAAIDKADEMGVIDRKRVGVGGHSYGAFMTANLLAHCDLFRAGIARSGAYNRTLTPFGFQSERRTLWEAPEMYVKVSPFMYAHKIKAPLLLIHGAADNNSGTFPIRSERMYHAIKGNGGTVRFVSLPHESHGYMARESVEHTLYEMIAWFDRYVKGD
jgi:dipeptidyl aminopeptidase/acylaminoacyl peptidase